MCVRFRPGAEVPELTVHLARASNPRAPPPIRDHPDGLWSDEDFAPGYLRDGKPGLSPAQLAIVCVLAFLMELSNRRIAEIGCRITHYPQYCGPLEGGTNA